MTTFPNERAQEAIEQMEKEGLVVPPNIKEAAARTVPHEHVCALDRRLHIACRCACGERL